MPLTAEAAPARPAGAGAGRPRAFMRVLVAAVAVAVVAAAMAALVAMLAPTPPPAPKRNPFGMGLREAAPSASGMGAYILAVQGSFFRSLQAGIAALKESGAAFWSLIAVGFAYGVFHAAGPGHGKAVIAGYLVASERALLKGILLSLAAALLQALVAIGIVTAAAIVLSATAATMDQVTRAVEIASFVAVAAIGAALTWRKAGKFVTVARLSPEPGQADSCGHLHLPPPQAIERLARFREMAGVVLAAGIRPCAGAIVVLVFALAQGLFAAGVAATFAMALGTALTTGAVATLAVFAKGLALRLAGGRGSGETLIAALELAAAAFVLVLGASLLMGMWSGAGS